MNGTSALGNRRGNVTAPRGTHKSNERVTRRQNNAVKSQINGVLESQPTEEMAIISINTSSNDF